MKLADIAVILAVLCAGLSGVLFSISAPQGSMAVIRTPSAEYRYSLKNDRILKIHGDLGDMEVEISGGKIRIKETACPKKICALRGFVFRAGDGIACVPNHVIIRIEGSGGGVDGITE